jgi:transaldolase
MTARGRSINVTLIFSLSRHRQVIEAYLHGLGRLVDTGGDPSRVHSAASFAVSRVGTETDRRLDEPRPGDLKERLGITKAKLVYQQYKERLRRLLPAHFGGTRRNQAALPLGVDVSKNPEFARLAQSRGADRTGKDQASVNEIRDGIATKRRSLSEAA